MSERNARIDILANNFEGCEAEAVYLVTSTKKTLFMI